jgi:hypothetical protein
MGHNSDNISPRLIRQSDYGENANSLLDREVLTPPVKAAPFRPSTRRLMPVTKATLQVSIPITFYLLIIREGSWRARRSA